MKKGQLKQNGVHLQNHEFATVRLFIEKGMDIELIPPSQIKGFRMPDMMMDGIPWEMKAPEGAGKKTMKNTLQNAAQQSGNIIVDLRRSRMDDEQAIKGLEREYRESKHIKRMKIIKKNDDIIDYEK